jgi:pilus assembly protein Flp/PilA
MLKSIVGIAQSMWKKEEGLTTVEYAIAGTLIALAVVTAFTNLGVAVGNQIAKITGVL